VDDPDNGEEQEATNESTEEQEATVVMAYAAGGYTTPAGDMFHNFDGDLMDEMNWSSDDDDI